MIYGTKFHRFGIREMSRIHSTLHRGFTMREIELLICIVYNYL